MSDVNKLAALRVGKAEDNKDITPLDLLRTMIHDIETGALKVDGLMILWFNRPKGEDWDMGSYRARVDRVEQLAFLELAKERHIRGWLNP
jgi:hypothetical protein